MKKFYLGMDVGTSSVGMACTDEQYNLLRAKGKDLWAVRLFDEAKSAQERREKRVARRRLERRKQRLEFLQGIFAPFIEDDKFFLRLNNSGFCEEDKAEGVSSRFSLFADENYTDRDFYKIFPTIFHLREALIAGEKCDLRHYYLALHHLIKYRGHFLVEGESVSDIHDIKKLFDDFNTLLSEISLEEDVCFDSEKAKDFLALALSSNGLNDKKKVANELFNCNNSVKKEWIALMLGASATPKKLFGVQFENKYKEEKSFTFKNLQDETFGAFAEVYEDEHFSLLTIAREIYNLTVFEKVLGGKDTISKAMVSIFDKHSSDLKLLKDFVKLNLGKDGYYKIFRSRKETANYTNYIGYNVSKSTRQNVKKCSKEDFYKFLRKELSIISVQNEEVRSYILGEIDKDNFLPKILNADNGLFPHQINGVELDAILKNLCKYYPQFAQKDDSGYTLAEKIKKIFLFKIPYFVGPLNDAHSKDGKGNAWIVRKADGKITPWNFENMVDFAASNERFIRRMTNKCTYLPGQDVLPKGSMFYQAFDVLNQINKLSIGAVPISVELKKEIFDNVYLKYKKVTAKNIENYLVLRGKCTKEELKESPLGGFDTQVGLKANMSSYFVFKDKFGEMVDQKPEMFEKIILWHTLNTDKNLVEKMILDNYGEIPEIKQNVKWIKGLTSFKEFGKLSHKLLCETYGASDPITGEVYTVLNRLYHTNCNFNQVLYEPSFGIGEAIENAKRGLDQTVTYDDVAGLYVSPMVRRGIWQALQMADEYVKAVGRAPDKIFVEVTRQDGEKGDKGRTFSRKKKLFDLYKNIGKDCKDIEDLIAELNHESVTDSRLRQERLYLYFMQLGRCAYTGDRIDLEDLVSDKYDVDHIVPRAITKDDSLDNKVLVKRVKNAEKTDQYPLPYGFTNQQGFWKMLKAKDLMSEKKYLALTRTKPLGEEDFREFVNRQIVVTSQMVKAIAELLKRKYESQGTKIVYSKATNVDRFKQKYDIVKCRETNDLHHARDAYLNIVVGNVYDTKFTSAYDYFYRKQDSFWHEYNLNHLFDRPVNGAWAGVSDIVRVKAVLAKPSMCVTRYAFTNNGAFYNETVYGKGDGAISAPRKMTAPYDKIEKYGGFKSLSTAYFAIVESKDKKDNLIKTIEAIPVLVDYKDRANKGEILKYLTDNGLKDPKIIVSKLKLKSLVSINGYRVWLAGVTGDRIILHNAQQWFCNEKIDLYLKHLVKLAEKDKAGRLTDTEKSQEQIPLVSNREGTTLYATRQENIWLYEQIVEKIKDKPYQGLSPVKSFAQKLEDKFDLFKSLTTFEQIKVLLQIVRFMKCNAECADLTLLKDGARCGTLLVGKNISDIDFAIIHQSPCGLTSRIQKI